MDTNRKDFEAARSVSDYEREQAIRQLSHDGQNEVEKIRDQYVQKVREAREAQGKRWQKDFQDRLAELHRQHPIHAYPVPEHARESAVSRENRLRHRAQADVDRRNNNEITQINQQKDLEIDSVLERENVPQRTSERSQSRNTVNRDFDQARQR